jgi:uncharacterized integral membrane protein
MRKTIRLLILVPLALLIVVFAVANRQTVVFTLDPLGSTDPNSPLAFAMPLFVLAIILVIVGVLIGGVATWLRQGKWRKSARQLDRDVRALRAEVETLRQRLAAETAKPPQSSTPKVALPPPAA